MASTTRLYSILFLYPSPTHSLILIKADFIFFARLYGLVLSDWYNGLRKCFASVARFTENEPLD